MKLLLGLLIIFAAPTHAATQRISSIDGIAIIDRLDVEDITPGTTERLWFRAGVSTLAQSWLVPVIVIKGAKAGAKLLVTAGIHGDELNGIDVIHRLASLDPATTPVHLSWCLG